MGNNVEIMDTVITLIGCDRIAGGILLQYLKRKGRMKETYLSLPATLTTSTYTIKTVSDSNESNQSYLPVR